MKISEHQWSDPILHLSFTCWHCRKLLISRFLWKNMTLTIVSGSFIYTGFGFNPRITGRSLSADETLPRPDSQASFYTTNVQGCFLLSFLLWLVDRTLNVLHVNVCVCVRLATGVWSIINKQAKIKEMYRSTHPPPHSTISDEGWRQILRVHHEKICIDSNQEIRREFYYRNVYKLFKQTFGI